MNTTKEIQDLEINRRMKQLLYKNIPLKLKSLPVTVYGAETWVMTKQIVHKLGLNQRAIEKELLGILLKHQKSNKWIKKHALQTFKLLKDKKNYTFLTYVECFFVLELTFSDYF